MIMEQDFKVLVIWYVTFNSLFICRLYTKLNISAIFIIRIMSE